VPRGFWLAYAVNSESPLNARDEFILSRAFSLGRHRNFWISALLIQSPNLNIANGSDPTPVSSTITHADSLLSMFSGKLPYHVKPSSATGQMMVNDDNTLDSYNNGLLTPGCSGN
jgi:hypothetical protein